MSPISLQLLQKLAPQGNLGIEQNLVAPLNSFLPQYGIDTPRRQAMFLAMAADETDGFKTLNEYASGAAYEGRKDLGNVEPGDGPRYKGRGIFQLTGRANYAKYGALLGIDLVAHPEYAAVPSYAARIACLYWQNEGLNYWADQGDVKHVTYLINGGYNGLADREEYYKRAITAFPDYGVPPIPLPPITRPLDPEASDTPAVPSEEPPVPSAPISPLPAQPWWQNWTLTGLISSGISGVAGVVGSAQGIVAAVVAVAIAVAVAAGIYEFIKYQRTGKF